MKAVQFVKLCFGDGSGHFAAGVGGRNAECTGQCRGASVGLAAGIFLKKPKTAGQRKPDCCYLCYNLKKALIRTGEFILQPFVLLTGTVEKAADTLNQRKF